jgi:hypothetical protein
MNNSHKICLAQLKVKALQALQGGDTNSKAASPSGADPKAAGGAILAALVAALQTLIADAAEDLPAILSIIAALEAL